MNIPITHKECRICYHTKAIGHFLYNKKANSYAVACNECVKSQKVTTELACVVCNSVKPSRYFTTSMIFKKKPALCQTCRHGRYKYEYKRENKKEDDSFERSCLSCDRKFVTNSKFIRLCSDCKKREVFN